MSNPRYPEELKIEAVKQVTERGLPVAEVAARLGMSTPMSSTLEIIHKYHIISAQISAWEKPF